MVRVAVCVKYSIDVSNIKVDRATQTPITIGVSRRMSDIDRRAVEEAIRIKEKHGGAVTAFTLGIPEARTCLREALAMGVDDAVLITDPILESSDTYVTSRVLANALVKLGLFDIILCGETSTDGYSYQVGPRIAEILNIPCITYAKNIALNGSYVTVERDLEDRYEVVKAQLPVLITVTREINEPRHPSTASMMKAFKKPIKTLNAKDVDGLDPQVQVLKVFVPELKRKSIVFKDLPVKQAVAEVVKSLVKEGVLK
jgi:electron transfer flavoprotein alpha/beta subunit